MKKLATVVVAYLALVVCLGDVWAESLELGHGISVNLPIEWTVLTEQQNSTLNKLGSNLAKEFIEIDSSPDKKTLLAADSPARTMRVRVSVTPVPDAKDLHDALPTLSKQDRDELLAALEGAVYAPLKGAGLFIESYPAHVSTFLNYNCFALSYLRRDRSASPWVVKMIIIPETNRLIHITYSYSTDLGQEVPSELETIVSSIKIAPNN